MKRSDARELLMQLLFQMSIHDDYSENIKDEFVANYQFKNQNEYFTDVFNQTITHINEIDSILNKNLNKWKLDRISKVELAILRLATAEILYIEEIPESVSINEAVDLAKKFGGNESGKFVNGILGKLVRDDEK